MTNILHRLHGSAMLWLHIFISLYRASHSKKEDGSRLWDKKYPCKFCLKLFPKLPRHLEDMHADKAEVAAFLALPKKSQKRRDLIEKIRSDGEKLHHCELCKKRDGTLNPVKRPQTQKEVTSYLPCKSCGRLVTRTYLARHYSKCKQSGNVVEGHENTSSKRLLRGLQSQCALLLPSTADVSATLKTEILEKMTYNDVYVEIINDKLILAFGEKLYDLHGARKPDHRTVKDKLREMGRFMVEVKKISTEIKSLRDLIHPTKYNLIVKAIKATAGFDEAKGTYATPSLVMKIGQSLKKVCDHLQRPLYGSRRSLVNGAFH